MKIFRKDRNTLRAMHKGGLIEVDKDREGFHLVVTSKDRVVLCDYVAAGMTRMDDVKTLARNVIENNSAIKSQPTA